jgi:type IV secretion system protein TrbL
MDEENDCGFVEFGCKAEEWVGSAVGDAIENLARAISEALSQIVTTLSTFWVDMPTSNLTTTDGVTASPTVAFLQGGLWYWTAALAVLAVIVGGTRMVWEQRGAPVRDLVRSLLTLTLVSGMGLAVIAFLIIAADGFSTWILDQATDGTGFAPAIQAMLLTGGEEVAVFMVIILGLVGIFASVIQIVLMVVRSGMLVILAGVLPTTAAFTNTEMGRQWFQKTIGWTIAFILYKPAAAIVYAVAFRLIDAELSGGNTLLNTITGMALMVVALVALPALLRFVTPMVGAVASGSGGGMAAGAVGAAAAAMPTGARSMGSAGRGGGSAAPIPASSAGGQGSGSGGGAGGKSFGSPSGSATVGSGLGGAKPTPGATSGSKNSGPSGAPAGGPAMAGAGAGGGGAATGAAAGARAGAVAGPAGMAAGAAVQGAAKGAQAVKKVSDEAAGEGPSGSNNQ